MTLGCLIGGGTMLAVDALLDPHVSFAPLAAALAGVGFGLGLALVAVTATVLTIVPAERSGMAASTLNTSRELGGVLAVATLGAVVNARIISDLTHRLVHLGVPKVFRALVINAVTHGGLPANAAGAAAASPLARRFFALIGPVIDAAKKSFGYGLHVALVVAAVILLAGAVVGALTTSGVRGAQLD
jgi:DHA2 family multidrug resistance protein-like MFS transporter